MHRLADFEFEIFKKVSNQDALPVAETWLLAIRKLAGISRAEISGELRRGKPAVNRIEIAAAARQPSRALEEICRLGSSQASVASSQGQIVIGLENGIELVVWVQPPHRFGSVLQHTTGSHAHNEWLADMAMRKGMQYRSGNLWNSEDDLHFADEDLLYATVGLPCIPPELREGSLEDNWLARGKEYPLISASDIQADLHIHSTWSDGANSLEQMAEAAIHNHLNVIAFTDHSPYIMPHRYTDHRYLSKQHKEIDRLREQLKGRLEVLKGVEVDILPDGSLDLPDDVLRQMDIVIASAHTQLDQPIDTITQRYEHAMQNPYVDIIGHPGGRLYPMADITNLDWERLFQMAARKGIALEINSHKSHPLFDDKKVRQAVLMGIPITLNSDAHHTSMFANSRFGLFIARRAGLTINEVINTWPAQKIRTWVKERRASAHGGQI